MSIKHPLRMTKAQQNAVARGQEAMWGDLREAKGIPAPVIEKDRARIKRTDIVTEHQHQTAVIKWWRYAHAAYQVPEFALFAIPNGGQRSPITAALLKAEGVRSGVPDLCLAVNRKGLPGLYMEMKREDGRLSDTQIKVMDWLALQGYLTATCYSADEAIRTIERYLRG